MKVHESIVHEMVHNMEFRDAFYDALAKAGCEFVIEFLGEQPIPVAPQIENQSERERLFYADLDRLSTQPDYGPF